MTTDDLVESWTGPLDFTLSVNGVAIDGSTSTISLSLRDRAQGLVNVTGEIAWLVASSGTVRYTPSVNDFKAERSPYQARFKVTDSNGKDVFFPNADALTWVVRK